MLYIKGLEKSYSNKQVLKDVNLHIEKGKILGFVGGNGAGKTTTLNIITDILQGDSGTVHINGFAKEAGLEYKKQFFYIPDTINVFHNIAGYDWILFIMEIFHKRNDKRLVEYIKIFDMEDSIKKPIGTYSYGMLHKMALIAAFTIHPPIIIMDEPINGLDPSAVVNFKEEIQNYVQQGGTVFFSTHLLDVAEKICDSVAILKDGIIILRGEVKHIVGDRSLESIFMEAQVYERDI